MTSIPTHLWGDQRRFNSYSGYFRRTFGSRIQKLSVNAGFTCPNRDGTVARGGCTFCNNDAFSPSYCQPVKSVRQQLEEGIEFHTRRYREATQYFAYFQSFSNTYASLDQLKTLYNQALDVPGVVGVIIGTRPDCVDDEKLDYLQELNQRHHVILEFGVESCYDETLLKINRGHDFETARQAIYATASRNIPVGAHFILGLPGETPQMWNDQMARINALPLTSIKFHQLQIFKGTAMAQDYTRQPDQFHFFELMEYIDLFIDLLERMRPDLVLERFAGEAPPRYHVGPTWGLIRNEQLLALFEKRLVERDTFQGRLYLG